MGTGFVTILLKELRPDVKRMVNLREEGWPDAVFVQYALAIKGFDVGYEGNEDHKIQKVQVCFDSNLSVDGTGLSLTPIIQLWDDSCTNSKSGFRFSSTTSIDGYLLCVLSDPSFADDVNGKAAVGQFTKIDIGEKDTLTLLRPTPLGEKAVLGTSWLSGYSLEYSDKEDHQIKELAAGVCGEVATRGEMSITASGSMRDKHSSPKSQKRFDAGFAAFEELPVGIAIKSHIFGTKKDDSGTKKLRFSQLIHFPDSCETVVPLLNKFVLRYQADQHNLRMYYANLSCDRSPENDKPGERCFSLNGELEIRDNGDSKIEGEMACTLFAMPRKRRDENPTLHDIPGIFSGIDRKKPQAVTIQNADVSSPSSTATSHIQGLAKIDASHHLVTTNYKDGRFGLMNGSASVQFDAEDGKDGFTHPGGVQKIGDYLVVGFEDGSKSRIRLYDLTGISIISPPRRVESFLVTQKDGAAAVGMTKYRRGGDSYYLLATIGYTDDGVKRVSLYRSEKNVPITDPNFEHVSTIPLTKEQSQYTGYSTLPLLTGTDGKVYMLGFRVVNKGVTDLRSYDDYAELFEIVIPDNGGKWELKCLKESVLFKLDGSFRDPHFRWGVAVDIVDQNHIEIIVTQRNSGDGKLSLRVFK